MLRKIISKKSGFTIAEIIVAFAIFVVMAGMVGQILQLTTNVRKQNNDYSRYLAAQEEQLAKVTKDQLEYDKTAGVAGGVIDIEFEDGSKINMPYQTRGAGSAVDINDLVGTNAALNSFDNSEEGLNLFLANVNYSPDAKSTGDKGTGSSAGASSDSQIARMNTRIAGTRGFDFIRVISVKKDTSTYAAGDPFAIPSGHTRYFIETCAEAGSMENEDVVSAEYRLYFFYDGDYEKAKACDKETKTDSGTVYNRRGPAPAPIVRAGYITEPSITGVDKLSESNSCELQNYFKDMGRFWSAGGKFESQVISNQEYMIRSSYNSIEVATPYYYQSGYGGKIGRGTANREFGRRFKSTIHSCFYVEFDGDPNLTEASFGYNAVSDGLGCKYSPCPKWNDSSATLLTDSATPPVILATPDYYLNIDKKTVADPTTGGTKEVNDTYVNIYGAYLNAKVKVDKPATPATPTPTPDPGDETT